MSKPGRKRSGRPNGCGGGDGGAIGRGPMWAEASLATSLTAFDVNAFYTRHSDAKRIEHVKQ